MSLVHYKVDPEPFSLATACRTAWPTPQRQTTLPRCVTCQACLDWMAANHKTVIAAVEKLRRSA